MFYGCRATCIDRYLSSVNVYPVCLEKITDGKMKDPLLQPCSGEEFSTRARSGLLPHQLLQHELGRLDRSFRTQEPLNLRVIYFGSDHLVGCNQRSGHSPDRIGTEPRLLLQDREADSLHPAPPHPRQELLLDRGLADLAKPLPCGRFPPTLHRIRVENTASANDLGGRRPPQHEAVAGNQHHRLVEPQASQAAPALVFFAAP